VIRTAINAATPPPITRIASSTTKKTSIPEWYRPRPNQRPLKSIGITRSKTVITTVQIAPDSPSFGREPPEA
jgi:hypothetical protein